MTPASPPGYRRGDGPRGHQPVGVASRPRRRAPHDGDRDLDRERDRPRDDEPHARHGRLLAASRPREPVALLWCPPRHGVGAGGGVGGVGVRTMLQRAFVVNAPLPVVWDHLSQVEAWPSWAGHIRRVHMDPAGRAHRALPRSLPLAGQDSLDLRRDGLRPTVELGLGRTVPVADRPLRSSLRGARRAADPTCLDSGGPGAWCGGPRAAVRGWVRARYLDRAIPNLQRELDKAGGPA